MERRRADLYRIADGILEVDTTRLGRPRARKAGQPWDWYAVCEVCLASAEAGGCLRAPGISGGFKGVVARTTACDTPGQEADARTRQRRLVAEAADFARRLDEARQRLAALRPGEVLDHLAAVYLAREPSAEVRPLGIVFPAWAEAPAFCDRAMRFAR